MHDWWLYPLLFGGGLVAGFVNVLAGAGSALTLPLLIFAGLSPAVANASNRIGILAENALASRHFLMKDLVAPRFAAGLALWTLPGAILGAWSSVHLGGALFQRILVLVLLFSAVTLYLPADLARRLHRLPQRYPAAIYPAMLLLGFYGGFIQAGIGFLFIFVLRAFLDIPLARINAHKTFIIALYTLPALLVFVLLHQVDWLLGGIVGAGAVVGAHFSSKLTLSRHGELWIKIVVTLVILAMGIRLWFF
ncbi:MAG: sulfite exporter TauE/SafE family protein [Acidithiobacillus sp.]|uniref:sulfite exporter TauE/SafE family protein n=1 Tax=Acidithiobacillus sp. TaxID=1872118 RepID=UPI003CFCD794